MSKSFAVFSLPVLEHDPETPGEETRLASYDERPHGKELKTAKELPTPTVRSAKKTCWLPVWSPHEEEQVKAAQNHPEIC